MTATTSRVEHTHLEVADARLHYVRAGSGPLIVFLHGFPQTWFSLRHQLEEFSRDHLAVAMDLRGHGDSSCPDGVERYGCLPTLRDLEALLRTLGRDQMIIVGHDWGGAVAWTLALQRPELVQAAVILCTAHPAAFDRAMRESPEQQEASAYMALLRREEFGGRRVAEMLAADDFALLRAQLDHPCITEEALAAYVRSWSPPGRLEAMLAWYRIHGIGPGDGLRLPLGNYAPQVPEPVVHVPTKVIYPDADTYIRPASHEDLDRWVPHLDLEIVPGAGHWIPEERPELVNASIRAFLERVGALVRSV